MMTGKNVLISSLLILFAVAVVFYSRFTIFVIKPVGAIPEGKTLIVSRFYNSNFIDSADAICERLEGKVDSLCRMAVLKTVTNDAKRQVRLPYSETLYLISTNGKKY